MNRPAPRHRSAAGADRGKGASVLCVTDGSTHQLVEMPTVRGGLLRMCTHVSHTPMAVGATGLRTLLVADVLLRAVEADGVQVVHVLVVPELPPEQAEALDRAMAAFGIHPPSAAVTTAAGVGAALGNRADVHIAAAARRVAEQQGVWIEVGRVQQSPSATPGLDEGNSADPLAARMALLERPYREPVSLTSRVVIDAERMLVAWRDRVADWARSPSRPVPDAIRRQVRAALADDLGTPGVLNVLRRVEVAREIPDGAKFEIFASADRVLGLELARDVGRS